MFRAIMNTTRIFVPLLAGASLRDRVIASVGAVLGIGDLVVAGAVTARGTKLPGYPVVNKAAAPGKFNWRVVSLDGTTAIGQTGLIEAI